MNDELLHSPLEIVEQAVLLRAKHGALDVSSSEGARRMRSFIDEEIEQWNLDHRRGLRPHDLADPELVAERAFRNLTGYGPLGPLLGLMTGRAEMSRIGGNAQIAIMQELRR